MIGASFPLDFCYILPPHYAAACAQATAHRTLRRRRVPARLYLQLLLLPYSVEDILWDKDEGVGAPRHQQVRLEHHAAHYYLVHNVVNLADCIAVVMSSFNLHVFVRIAVVMSSFMRASHLVRVEDKVQLAHVLEHMVKRLHLHKHYRDPVSTARAAGPP